MNAEDMTIHFSELPPGKPDSPLYAEWETYRREAPRLLAEGHEGRWVLLKGTEIIGIWDMHDEALWEGTRRYLLDSFLIHRILTREPVIRGPIFRPCHK